MKLLAHDKFRTFDYTEMMNDIYCVMIDRNWTPEDCARDNNLHISTVFKAFNYQAVSLPTLLLLASWADLNLCKYIIVQD